MINTIIHDKIENVIDSLPEIDLLLTDPPYGIDVSNQNTVNDSKTHVAKRRDYTKYDWDKSVIDMSLMNRLIEKANYSIIWGGNYYPMPASSCWFIWDKHMQASSFADCELAWTNLPGAVRKFDWEWNGMLKKVPEKRWHPTQKPEGIINMCLDQFEKKVKRKPTLVLDPFAGSGTTLVCCKKRGIDYIGVEMIDEYIDIIKQRLSRGGLFDV